MNLLIISYFALTIFVWNIAALTVDTRINQQPLDKVMRVLVTLKGEPDLSIAESAKKLYEHIQEQQNTSLLDNLMASAQSLDSFEATNYRSERGKYVHKQLLENSVNSLNSKKFIQELNRQDAKLIRQFFITNTFLVEATGLQLQNVLGSCNDIVAEVFLDSKFSVPLGLQSRIPIKQERRSKNSIEWNIQQIEADKVWKQYGASGFGMVFASADTGVDFTHPALRGNYAGLQPNGEFDHNYCWWDGVKETLLDGKGVCGTNSPVPCDDNGHGTHTTSTAVGREGLGVAPGAKWIACRNMDRGVGASSTYLGCLEFFLAPTDLNGKNPRPEKRPHVIGNSYGCPDVEGCAPHAFSVATKVLKAAGILMSVSAGNNGPICGSIDTPPAFEPLVFTVGALSHRSQRIASFSSRGPVFVRGMSGTVVKPDFVAPGDRIKGAYLNGQYFALSGTSMASPHLSGLLLMISEACSCMERNVDAIYQVLVQAAQPLRISSDEQTCGGKDRDTVPNYIYGYGMIDALKSIQICMQKCPKSI